MISNYQCSLKCLEPWHEWHVCLYRIQSLTVKLTCWKEFKPFIQNNGEEFMMNIIFIGLSSVICNRVGYSLKLQSRLSSNLCNSKPSKLYYFFIPPHLFCMMLSEVMWRLTALTPTGDVRIFYSWEWKIIRSCYSFNSYIGEAAVIFIVVWEEVVPPADLPGDVEEVVPALRLEVHDVEFDPLAVRHP